MKAGHPPAYFEICNLRSDLGIFRFRPRVAVHVRRPLQEAPQLVALLPHKAPELEEADLIGLESGVRLDPPFQVGTAPGREPVSARRVPEKAKQVAHELGAPPQPV